MRVRDALSSGKIAGFDREVLLAVLMGKERTWILAHPEQELTKDEEKRWSDWLDRREKGEPVSYITGFREFYGHLFHVDPSTLIPRPATERLCSIALDLLGKKSGPARFEEEIDGGIVAAVRLWKPLDGVRLVADIGTGSGCIGITIACERTDLRIIATDVSAQALSIASRNASHLHAKERMAFACGRGLEPLAQVREPFLIVSNPPYIPEGMRLEKDVADFEPHGALFSGKDGGDVIRDIVSAAMSHPYCVGYVIECRKDQSSLLLAPM